MATSQASEAVRLLGRAVLLGEGTGLTDGQLLADYLSRRDTAALAAVVRRHGPMVWGVCRRVLRDRHDAEDAFQATFLVLVRKAGSIAARELLANWLYGVAHRTARTARANAARRREREKLVSELPEPALIPVDPRPDLYPLLDAELSRLPDKYRLPVLLCDLEGRTRREVAEQLGWPEGTVAGRLARARSLLARRLARHGIVPSAAALASGVPAAVVASTIHLTAGPAAGPIPARVAALAEGVQRAMFLTKLKTAVAVVLAVALIGPGTTWVAQQALAQKPTKVKGAGQKDASEVTGIVTAVVTAGDARTITLRSGKPAESQTFGLATDAQVFLDDGSGDKAGFQAGKLTDLAAGVPVTVRLGEGRKVVRVWVDGPSVHGTLKAVDAAKGTITVAVSKHKGEPPADETFTVGKNARVEIDDGKPKDKIKPVKAAALADLPVNALVSVKLSADRKVVGSVRAEGQSVTGNLKAVDAAKNTITIIISVKGQPEEEKTFKVADAVPVTIDDGKARDKTKPAEGPRLADVPVGGRVVLRLAADGQSVVAVRAEGGTVHGTVKAVDAAKGTVTVHDKQNPDGKTYTVSPDAAVLLDDAGEGKKLADVPAGAVVELKLLADQKTVRDVRVTGPTAMGTVAGPPANDSITLRQKGGDQTYTVGPNARISIDGAREGKLAELIEGTVARLRQSVDQSKVLEVHAEGPSYKGKVKSFDADAGTIVVTVGFKMNVEDKEFKLTKDTAVVTEVYGAPVPRADLKAEREVVVRLGIDQKAAARITVLGQ